MNTTFFVQPCPTCGRSLRIQVRYLGRTLNCQHCSGKVVAKESDANASQLEILDRANALLRQAKIA